ncbi:MAG TPA: FoF1 ATP synthase subunit a [Candidatus Obscuribacterales bacterium]
MLGKNLRLSQFIDDPSITNINFMGPLGDIHVDTLVLSWLCMGGILGAAALITPRLVTDGPGGKAQAVLEGLYLFTQDIAKNQIGHHFRKFFPLVAAIFIFVLTANFIGVGPWRFFEHFDWWPNLPAHGHEIEKFELASPTTDFNVTAGLALVSLIVYLGSGFWAHGASFAKVLAFNPIEWLDAVIRPSTLALRLMVVITADELLRAAFLTIMPVLLPTFVMGFELFIGVIQAFVFALLTSIYIGLTVAEHH